MKSWVIVLVTIAAIALSFILINKNKTPAPEMAPAQNMKILKISSEAFEQNFSVPSKYTCEGENVNPPLQIENVPENAKSLALIMDDPDAPMGTFVHWVKWNIPATTTVIKEGAEPAGASGKGGSGQNAYVGPCPPSGEHRYFFKIYALDTELNIAEGTDKAGLEKAMEGHIIAWGELMGRYQKGKK